MRRPSSPWLFRIVLTAVAPLATILGASSEALASGSSATALNLPMWSVIPFASLLICIAVLPLVAHHFWENNRNKGIISVALGLPVAIFVGIQDIHPVLHALHEYISFLALLGSLYVISGGLVLRGDIQATPLVNTSFLAIGAVLANFIGTTGASMLLIRPMLRTNSQRQFTGHIPLFFIFIVANMGGMLTPLGDPPLFLGYLRDVPFFWTLRLLPIWATTVGITLAVFYIWDRGAYDKESVDAKRMDKAERVPLSLVGRFNIGLLGGVIGSVFLPTPWREIGMVVLAGLSMKFTSRDLREENGFTFHPITEVAVLFIGIFLAMVPALELLRIHGAQFGLSAPWQFFWATGLLSSFLDNAPTYVSFLSLAQGLGLEDQIVGIPHNMLAAISAGAVLMGANSYIGNGPNFMVKAIADEARLHTPSFFGYMGRSALILWPIFLVVTLIFFI